MTPPLYQPLRIPHGWCIDWSTFFEIDPTEVNVRRGFFGGSSLFQASHRHRRFAIDIEWRPEDDPAGHYRMRVIYAHRPRHDDGRRKEGEDLHFDWQSPIHEFTTRDRLELIRELEAWLLKCIGWVREPN